MWGSNSKTVDHVPEWARCWADEVGEFVVPGEANPRKHECWEAATTDIGLCDKHYDEIVGSRESSGDADAA